MNIDDGGADAEFAEFEGAGDVQVGESNKAPAAETEEEVPKPKRGRPPKAKEPSANESANQAPASADAGSADATGEDGDTGDDDEIDEQPKRKTARERIQELNKRARDAERRGSNLEARLAALEKGAGQPNNFNGSSGSKDSAPDPSDQTKYPLGHLDDRYIEDKLDWLATEKATKLADAALQRQQETEQSTALERQQAALMDTVDTVSAKGVELYDDFQEVVVDAGLKGDWALTQTTFEAAAESEHGPQILYELAENPKEAKRVASLSNIQQLRFVDKRNSEIAEKMAGRKIPKAGAPPQTQTRGANSSTRISPTTDNLDDFEKAWEADAKGKK